MAGPIVVGYDGTGGAKVALGEAVRLAKLLDAEIVCAFARHVGAVGSERIDLATAVEEHGEAVLAEARALAGDVPLRSEVVDGRPADVLTLLAEREDAQMIVIGSYGERPLRGILLGSTPYRLLQEVTVPVLVVPAHRG